MMYVIYVKYLKGEGCGINFSKLIVSKSSITNHVCGPFQPKKKKKVILVALELFST